MNGERFHGNTELLALAALKLEPGSFVSALSMISGFLF